MVPLGTEQVRGKGGGGRRGEVRGREKRGK